MLFVTSSGFGSNLIGIQLNLVYFYPKVWRRSRAGRGTGPVSSPRRINVVCRLPSVYELYSNQTDRLQASTRWWKLCTEAWQGRTRVEVRLAQCNTVTVLELWRKIVRGRNSLDNFTIFLWHMNPKIITKRSVKWLFDYLTNSVNYHSDVPYVPILLRSETVSKAVSNLEEDVEIFQKTK